MARLKSGRVEFAKWSYRLDDPKSYQNAPSVLNWIYHEEQRDGNITFRSDHPLARLLTHCEECDGFHLKPRFTSHKLPVMNDYENNKMYKCNYTVPGEGTKRNNKVHLTFGVDKSTMVRGDKTGHVDKVGRQQYKSIEFTDPKQFVEHYMLTCPVGVVPLIY